MQIPARLRRSVVERARERCEFCRLAQTGQEATFHVDHVIPVVAGGETTLDNLALACVSCSLRKGARQRAPDPVDGSEVELFNPRRDLWAKHFSWDGTEVIAQTPTGRCTIAALQLNRATIRAIRIEELLRGRHPPSSNDRESA
jgi:hypothetical protein